MTHKRNAVPTVLVLIPLFLCMSAAEGEAGGGSTAFLGKVVNFLILFGGLAFLLYKPAKAFLENKAGDARRFLEDAEASRVEAEARREGSRARLDGVAVEAARMKSEAGTRGRLEKDRIARAAEEEAARLRDLAAREIETQTQAAVRELRGYVAEAATSIARESIRASLAPGDQASLVDRSIERLSKRNEKFDPD